MKIKVSASPLTGSLKIIASKSLSHRYMIASALAHGTSKIDNILDADDLKATHQALEKMNASIHLPYIKGPISLKKSIEIQAFESGSTLRFLIPIALLFDQEVLFKGDNQLPNRPLTIYEQLSKQHHFIFKKKGKKNLPLLVKGPLQSGQFVLEGNVSSQFVSGLMFVLPLLKGDSQIIFTSPLESIGYVDLTIDVLKKYQIEITKTALGYDIKGNQHYFPINDTVEGDYSQAAFFIVAGLIGKDMLVIEGLNEHSLQGDKAILDIVSKMNGRVYFKEGLLYVEPSKTSGTTIDLKDIPDLGPILMVLASLSNGTTIFLNTQRLEIKESNRLLAMYENLKIMGVDITICDNQATIHGNEHFNGNIVVEGYKDHRIVMAMAIASIRALGDITITDANAILKSYPTFFKDFVALGGILNELR